APSVVGRIVFMCFYGRNRVLPVMTDVSQLLPSFVIVQTVFSGLTRPFGRPFKVTPKGSLSGGVTVQWSYLLPFALAALGTLLGILINTSAYSELNGAPGFGVNVFWSIYNIAILLLAAAVCIELPQQREHARFPVKEQAIIRAQGQAESVCTIADISLGGAKIAGSPPAWANDGERGVLLLEGGAMQVPFRFTGVDCGRNFGQGFPIVFEAGIPLRRALTARLFGGAYRGTIEDIDVPRVIFASASGSCDEARGAACQKRERRSGWLHFPGLGLRRQISVPKRRLTERGDKGAMAREILAAEPRGEGTRSLRKKAWPPSPGRTGAFAEDEMRLAPAG